VVRVAVPAVAAVATVAATAVVAVALTDKHCSLSSRPSPG
jgi:hypothetical protein